MQFVNNKKPQKVFIPDLLIDDKETSELSENKNRTTDTDREKSEVLNRFFTSVFATAHNDEIPEKTTEKLLDINIDLETDKKKLLNSKLARWFTFKSL